MPIERRKDSDADVVWLSFKRKLVYIVWVSFEGMITENTLKEEWTDKNDFNDNYQHYYYTLLLYTIRL